MVFVVGYLREKIQEYVSGAYEGRFHFQFVVQEPRRGLAHALWLAREHFRGEQEVLVVLGDTIFGNDTQHILQMEGSVLAVHQVDDPRTFGVAVLDMETQRVRKVAEKPSIPTSNLALVGMYKFAQAPLLAEVLDEMMAEGLEEGREYLLTDAIMQLIRRGVSFRTHGVEDWFDCGKKQTLLLANRILLGRSHPGPRQGFPNTVIIPPVYIGEGCEIEHAIIGPYVAIGEHARIRNSVVSNSILGAYSRLEAILLNGSVIGSDSSLRGRSISIHIGDNTEIDFE
jgi:glucose-1-phosphate thymidylyltransferase